MELKGSLLRPQKPVICSYPYPDQLQSIPPPYHFLKTHFNIILPTLPSLATNIWHIFHYSKIVINPVM